MIDYSKAAIQLILDDVKKFKKFFKLFSLVFTTGYFIYVLVTQSGLFVANIVLSVLFLGYTMFEFITAKKDLKPIKRIVKRSYAWTTLAIKLITLGAMLYGIYTATKAMTAMSIILATLMIVFWVLQVILELLIQIVENKVDLVTAAVQKDIDNIKKPMNTIGNVFKKIRGEEIPPEPEKSKQIIRLEKKIKMLEEEKKSRKEVAKEEKKTRKEEAKAVRKQKRKTKAEVKALPIKKK